MAEGERRKHRRIRARGLAAHVRALDRSFTCAVENLSEGGIFLATEQPLPRGSMVAIDLIKPGFAKALRVIGIVVAESAGGAGTPAQASASGMGIQFAQQGPDTRVRLLALLSEFAGQPPRTEGTQPSKDESLPPAAAASIRAIVTPFVGEPDEASSTAWMAPPATPAQASRLSALRARVQTVEGQLAEMRRERNALAAEVQKLKAQLIAARAGSTKAR